MTRIAIKDGQNLPTHLFQIGKVQCDVCAVSFTLLVDPPNIELREQLPRVTKDVKEILNSHHGQKRDHQDHFEFS